MLKDQPLRGWWFDRTREFAARRRGKRPGRYDYAEEETLVLEPLPCWRHLPAEEVRQRVREIVREAEEEAAVERRKTGKQSQGAEAVMAADPHYRPDKLEHSPAPTRSRAKAAGLASPGGVVDTV